MAMIGVLWVSFVHILASAKVYTNRRSLKQGFFLRFLFEEFQISLQISCGSCGCITGA
jgi:hypothetical protein